MDVIFMRAMRWASERGMDQVQLGKALGVSKQVVSNWKREGVPAKWHQPIATYFGRTVDELLGNPIKLSVGKSDNLEPVVNMAMVPVLNTVNAGMFKEIIDTHPEDIEYVPVYGSVKRYTFALRVEGDSMTPGFPHGCVVIVDTDAEAKPNDFVIVMNGDEEVTFKQLVKDGGEFYLKPRNPQWPIKPLGSAKIVGVVKGAQMFTAPGDDNWPG